MGDSESNAQRVTLSLRTKEPETMTDLQVERLRVKVAVQQMWSQDHYHNSVERTDFWAATYITSILRVFTLAASRDE